MTLLAAMIRPSATMAKASAAGEHVGADVLVLVRDAEHAAAGAGVDLGHEHVDLLGGPARARMVAADELGPADARGPVSSRTSRAATAAGGSPGSTRPATASTSQGSPGWSTQPVRNCSTRTTRSRIGS